MKLTRFFGILAVCSAVALMPIEAQAQLQTVEQTVFGMDCAPCAHAMEQSLGSMKGVDSVSVSLNDGVASIHLAGTNTVAYREIRKTVSNGGFAAKEAILTVRGTVRQKGKRWILKTPAGERFVLESADDAGSAENPLEDLKPNQKVTVTGRVTASDSEQGRWPMKVQNIRPT